MIRRRTAVTGAAAVIVIGGAGIATAGLGGEGGGTPRRGPLPPATAAVERTTLVETQEVDGTLGYGAESTAASTGNGTLTWLARPGAVISRGRPAFKIDNLPVPLLYGRLPVYRALSKGVEGADVEQLERNLRALGYTGFTVDETFGSATATAVRAWQDDLGTTETGRVEPGSVLVASGRIRVAARKANVGDRAGGAALAYTGTTRKVSLDLDVKYQRLAKKGSEVTITLPGGGTTKGTISGVGKVATEGEGGNATTIQVSVAVRGQRSLGSYDKAPVGVHLTADRHEDVLAVPVAALLARPGGGYAVQVVEGAATRTVPVETGVFSEGSVEVSGSGVREGMKVGVPR